MRLASRSRAARSTGSRGTRSAGCSKPLDERAARPAGGDEGRGRRVRCQRALRGLGPHGTATRSPVRAGREPRWTCRHGHRRHAGGPVRGHRVHRLQRAHLSPPRRPVRRARRGDAAHRHVVRLQSCRACDVEYGSRGARGFFAQRGLALRPSYLRMFPDILRFYGDAGKILDIPSPIRHDAGRVPRRPRLRRGFRDHFLVPITAAVWSTRPGGRSSTRSTTCSASWTTTASSAAAGRTRGAP